MTIISHLKFRISTHVWLRPSLNINWKALLCSIVGDACRMFSVASKTISCAGRQEHWGSPSRQWWLIIWRAIFLWLLVNDIWCLHCILNLIYHGNNSLVCKIAASNNKFIRNEKKNHCYKNIESDYYEWWWYRKREDKQQKYHNQRERASTKNIKNFTREKIKDKFLAKMCAITFQKLFALNYSRKMSRKKGRKINCAKVAV